MELLITLLVFVLILGVVYYIVTLIPLPPPLKNIALIIVAVIALLYLLGVMFGAAPLPRFR